MGGLEVARPTLVELQEEKAFFVSLRQNNDSDLPHDFESAQKGMCPF